MNQNFEKFRFNDAALSLYDFIWHKFCDWYLEISKVDLYSKDRQKQEKGIGILLYVLKQVLKLLHPIMPFITEEIWLALPDSSETILKESWPAVKKDFVFEHEKMTFDFIKNIIYSVRNIRGETGIEPSKKIHILVRCGNTEKNEIISQYDGYIKFLASVELIEHGASVEKPEQSYSSVIDEETEVFIPIKGNMDMEREKSRLEKTITKLEKDIEKLHLKLNNDNFAKRAPVEIVAETRKEYDDFIKKIEMFKNNLEGLK